MLAWDHNLWWLHISLDTKTCLYIFILRAVLSGAETTTRPTAKTFSALDNWCLRHARTHIFNIQWSEHITAVFWLLDGHQHVFDNVFKPRLFLRTTGYLTQQRNGIRDVANKCRPCCQVNNQLSCQFVQHIIIASLMH